MTHADADPPAPAEPDPLSAAEPEALMTAEPGGRKGPSEGARGGRWIKIAAVSPLLAGILVYGLYEPFRTTIDEGVGYLVRGDLDGLEAWGHSLGAWAPLATTGLMVIQALAAPIPAVLVTATNSLLFGPFVGGVLSISSATLAAMICYGIARLPGDAVARLVPDASLRRAEVFFDQHGATAVLGARLVPFVPFDPISYAAGLVRVPFWSFTWATFVGQIPAGMAYSYLAQNVTRPVTLAIQATGVFLVLVLLGVFARRRLLARKKLPTES